MTQLGLLRLEVFLVVWVRFAANRHLLDHFQTVAFQADHFLWIVRQETELPHAEIEKYLRAESVIAQVRGQTEFGIGFYRIESFLLQFVSMNFCRQTNTAAFLAHINEHAVARFRDLPQRRVQLIAAVAPLRTKNVARETFAMH